MKIDLGDDIPEDVLTEYLACEVFENGEVTACEFYDCLVETENRWRDKYCPGACENLYCSNVIDEDICICPDSHSCEDLETKA